MMLRWCGGIAARMHASLAPRTPARSGSAVLMRTTTLLLSAILLLTGCGKRTGPDRPGGGAVKDLPVTVEQTGELDSIASPEAVRGGTYSAWGGGFPKSLNMWLDFNSFSKSITELMFEGLVEMHSTRDEPRGLLAVSWTISEDRKTFTFQIHPDAKWSDGRPVTAEDIQFYYDVIMNPKHLTSLFRVDMSRFSRPEVLGEKTVRLMANQAHWMNFWTAAGFVAFPKHAWEGKDFNAINFEFPVVSGPYALDEVKMNRSVSLKRRGDWWGRVKKSNQYKYNFDHVVFKSMEDRVKALETLKRGDFDVCAIYTARIWAQQTDFPQVQKNWVVRQTVFNQEPKAFQGFALNLRRPIFQDQRVREALACLLNRELMNEKLMFNEYFLLNSYYPDLYPGNRNPDAPFVKFDPERARRLLAEAGWAVDAGGTLVKDGAPFEIVFLHHGEDLRHLNIYLEDLKSVGIRARVDLVSEATYTKRKDYHEFDMLWANWGATRLRDPESMWSSKTADDIATQNVCGFKDEEIDRLIEAQKTEMDLGRRNEILKAIDRRLTRIMPYVLLWQSDRSRLLYWNKFGTPRTVLNKFDREDVIPIYWWYDSNRADALAEAMRRDQPLPAVPAEVHYTE
jgi:microcin C transport system substrate-binding protein